MKSKNWKSWFGWLWCFLLALVCWSGCLSSVSAQYWHISGPHVMDYPYPGHPAHGYGGYTNDWSKRHLVLRVGPNTQNATAGFSPDYGATDWRWFTEMGLQTIIYNYGVQDPFHPVQNPLSDLKRTTNATPWVLISDAFIWDVNATGYAGPPAYIDNELYLSMNAASNNWWGSWVWSPGLWVSGISLRMQNTNTSEIRWVEFRNQCVSPAGEPLRLVASSASDNLNSSATTTAGVTVPRIEYAPPSNTSAYRRDIVCKVTWATMDQNGKLSESSTTSNYYNQITWAYEDMFDNGDDLLYEFTVEVTTKTPGTNTQVGYRKFRWFR
jgi:hypothetical protein